MTTQTTAQKKNTSTSSSSASASFLSSVSDDTWALAGDAVIGLCLVNTVALSWILGGGRDSRHAYYFDSEFQHDGFCVAHREVRYWNTHEVCKYVNIWLALTLGGLRRLWKDRPGMEEPSIRVQAAVVPIFMHGFRHGQFSKALFPSEDDDGESSEDPMDEVSKPLLSKFFEREEPMDKEFVWPYIQLILFWIIFSFVCMRNLPSKTLTVAVGLCLYARHLCSEPDFEDTFAQHFFLVFSALNALYRPKEEKGFSYFLYPLMVDLPLCLLAWAETMHCSTVLLEYFYGHLIYDVYFPLAVMVWYTIQYWTQKKLHAGKDKDAKVKTL